MTRSSSAAARLLNTFHPKFRQFFSFTEKLRHRQHLCVGAWFAVSNLSAFWITYPALNAYSMSWRLYCCGKIGL